MQSDLSTRLLSLWVTQARKYLAKRTLAILQGFCKMPSVKKASAGREYPHTCWQAKAPSEVSTLRAAMPTQPHSQQLHMPKGKDVALAAEVVSCLGKGKGSCSSLRKRLKALNSDSSSHFLFQYPHITP